MVSNQPVPLLDLSREYTEVGAEINAAVEQVLRSQSFILGPQVASFERAAADVCHTAHAVGCASGTDALWLALDAAGVAPGERVVTTAFSFFASVSSILRLGAAPVLADIDPRSFNLSPASVAAVLEREQGVRAILPVHLYGQCADWTAFTRLATEFDCLLVEDAAQAFGARWQDVPTGALGKAAAFSFYPTKNLSAAGDAGMITTQDEQVARHCRRLRSHGMDVRYYHEEVGWNSRLDSIQAAVLLVKLAYVERWTQQRRTLASSYAELFQQAGLVEPGPYPEHGVVLPWVDARAYSVFHQYVVRVPRRDALRAHLTNQQIGTEIYYPLGLHQQKALAGLGYRQGDFPETERAAREVLALPMFPQLRPEEQQRVVAAIAAFLC
jgi:dTDP-4-amino-4,6-dideoxygalactose transaminase